MGVAMTDRTSSEKAAFSPLNTAWRKSRHSNPDGSCVEVATPACDDLLPHDAANAASGDNGVAGFAGFAGNDGVAGLAGDDKAPALDRATASGPAETAGRSREEGTSPGRTEVTNLAEYTARRRNGGAVTPGSPTAPTPEAG
jgi:hypothetical protein